MRMILTTRNSIRPQELPISKFIIKRNTKTYTTAVNQETLDKIETLIKNTRSITPLHKIPKHNSLNNLICKIANREEAQLLPSLISQWRRCLLPITFQTTKLLFNCLCDEKIGGEDVMFKMLADRKKYGLLPDVEGFRLLMLRYSNKISGDDFWKERNYFIDEKIKLLFTDLNDNHIQEIIDSNKDDEIQNKEDPNKTQKKKDAKKGIEEVKEETVVVEKNEQPKTESELYLDKLFKTFGLMTYYDLSQYDPYLFLIILSASMKLNTIESIKRIDITSKEFLEVFLNSEKKIDYSTKNDISVYSFTLLQNILELEEIHRQKRVLPTQLHDIVEATVDTTTLEEQIIKLNTKLSSKSEKQLHYIEILEKFIENRGNFFVAEKENQQNFNKQKHVICSNTLNLMTNYYNKLSKLEKRDNIEKYKKILQLNYQYLCDGFKNLKLVWELEYNHNHISSNSSKDKRHCWKCGSQIDYKSLHCERKDCGVIQKALPADINYFEMLNIVDKSKPIIFDIDESKLKRNFLLLQQQVHPDSYGNKDKQEYTNAQQLSSSINKAYQVLKEPLLRAKYILHLNNIDISESESVQDPQLLMETWESREKLEEAESEDEVKSIKLECDENINQIIKDLSDAFNAKDFVRAKELTIKLEYWNITQKATINWSPGKKSKFHH
ncbi:2_t:CDS:2 [Entrophospora sp. SA101]|nr:2_t:CDS:2 [Entrophospora sp. SA101]